MHNDRDLNREGLMDEPILNIERLEGGLERVTLNRIIGALVVVIGAVIIGWEQK